MRRGAVQDTGDRKKEDAQINVVGGGADMPPRLGSMWKRLACSVWCRKE